MSAFGATPQRSPLLDRVHVTNTADNGPGGSSFAGKLRLAAMPGGADVLPGAAWLGYGYRPFGLLVDPNYVSRDNLFTLSDWDTAVFNGKTYAKPAVMNALLEGGPAQYRRTNQCSIRDAMNSVSGKVSAGGGWGGFKGEFSLAFSERLERHWEYRSVVIQMELPLARLTLPDDMRTYMTPSFTSALNNAAEDAIASAAGSPKPHSTDFSSFFDKWGTHYISGIIVGGKYVCYMTFQAQGYKSATDIEAKAKAAYAGFSASAEAKISEAISSLDSRDDIQITAYGGISTAGDWTDLVQWQNAVRVRPGACSFYGDDSQGLARIYELVTDAGGRKALEHEWNTYCMANGLALPGVGRAVTAVKVACHKDANKARQLAKEGGFDLIDVDMNTKAGGPFIFVGKKFGDAETEEPILDIVGVAGKYSNIQPPDGYVKHPTDLNQGVHGDFIYLCSTTDPSGDRGLLLPIRDIGAECSDKEQKALFFKKKGRTPVCEPGGDEPLDMNRGAGGAFVYLTYTREYRPSK